MKDLFGILIFVFLALVCTSCEKYESLNVKYHDIFGTWKLIEYTDGIYGGSLPRIDHLTIVRSDEKKLIGEYPNKLSKFADYKAHLEGELVGSGEVLIVNQFDDLIWISFTNNTFRGSNQIAIESLDKNEMILNSGYPEYTLQYYSFINVSNTIE